MPPPETNLVPIDADTYHVLSATAAREQRSISDVIADATIVYVRDRSAGYRHYFELAGRLLDAAEGSEERIRARDELVAIITHKQGARAGFHGGDPLAVLARLKLRQHPVPPSNNSDRG